MKKTLQPSSLLAGLTPADFMRRYWHKRPLLIRQAVPGFEAPIDRDTLFALAARDDVEARLVTHFRRRWRLGCGPFAVEDLPSVRARQWTLLVQGVNLHHPAAHDLMNRFRFVPDVRLDDLMISYATDGGGVGPHFDSYDVFLLQAHGKRRWRISAQRDAALVEGLPLKILSRFEAEQEWVLEPGDMLYLPPGYAHDGTAEGECMTYSIGFRAPMEQEVLQNFLYFLAENTDTLPLARDFSGRYADPDQPATDRPGQLPGPMVEHLTDRLARLRWGKREIAQFLGTWLSEPKPQVFFSPPARPVSATVFARRATRQGLALSARSQLLYDGSQAYINGESLLLPTSARGLFHCLADQKHLSPEDCKKLADGWDILYDWYRAGWLELRGPAYR